MKHLLFTVALSVAAAWPVHAGVITFDPVDEQGITLAPGDQHALTQTIALTYE